MLVERAHEELRIAGARPRRLAFSGLDALTASERRVAEMAAAGMTNRHIAQELFVTPKTVEQHLTAVFRKLDLTNRRELPDALR
jgi:DNA-binding NarL/FixJ family response regulator